MGRQTVEEVVVGEGETVCTQRRRKRKERDTELKFLLRMKRYIRVLLLLYVVESFFDCTGEPESEERVVFRGPLCLRNPVLTAGLLTLSLRQGV